MLSGEILPAMKDDVAELERNIREDDREELFALGHHPRSMIFEAMGDGEVMAGWGWEDDGPRLLLCIFGAQYQQLRTAAPWMVSTFWLPHFAKVFLPGSKAWIDTLAEDYDLLHNIVDARNAPAIKWLKWLGFAVDPENPVFVEPSRRRFYPFRLELNACARPSSPLPLSERVFSAP